MPEESTSPCSSSFVLFLCFGRAKELILSITVELSPPSSISSPDELKEEEDVDVVDGSEDTDGLNEVVGASDGDTDIVGIGDIDGASDG